MLDAEGIRILKDQQMFIMDRAHGFEGKTIGIQVIIVNQVKISPFPWVVTKPEIGQNRIFGTVVLNQ